MKCKKVMLKFLFKAGVMMWGVVGMLSPVWADTVYMKNGLIIEGAYMGGNAETIRFQTKHGMFIYQISQLIKITFPATLSSLPRQKTFSLPSDTRIAVRMSNELDTLISKQGDRFRAHLEIDIVVDNVIVVPRKTVVQGEVLKCVQGVHSSVLVITLQEILLDQHVIPIKTTNYSIWYKPRDASDTFRRSRALRIPYGASIEFRTTAPIDITKIL